MMMAANSAETRHAVGNFICRIKGIPAFARDSRSQTMQDSRPSHSPRAPAPTHHFRLTKLPATVRRGHAPIHVRQEWIGPS